MAVELMRTDMESRAYARRSQAGMSLVELMIAMLVLAIGLAGVLLMITAGIASNNRNKHDTTGTTVSQMVLEQIISRPATTSPIVQLQDCRPAAQGGPQTHNINTAGAAPVNGAGAPLLAAGQAAFNERDIDWTVNAAAVPAGYSMMYFTCGTFGREATYEVRWNVINVPPQGGGPVITKLVTVSSRKSGATTADIRTFAPPVTLRSLSGR